MDHYLDCRVRPDDAMTEPVLLSAVFGRLHLALAERGKGDIGASFPAAERTLGGVLRLHGTAPALSELMQPNWLARLSDHCRTEPIQPIPESTQWMSVRRVQPQLTAAKLRRLVSRGSVSPAEAEQRLRKPSKLAHPYLSLRSLSSGQNFKLFIAQRTADAPAPGARFSAYGLGGTVPAF